jgi:DNA-3-methyladenine glycosylase
MLKSLLLPHSNLLISPKADGFREFPRSFYRKNTIFVARHLIGAWLVRKFENRWYGARIVETEAYLGSKDPAAHTHAGRHTPRVEPMYMDGGHLYVFLVYGMHHCMNVVTRRDGIAEAVLLRAAEGPAGTPAALLRGPGKLSRGLGITVASSGADLLSSTELRLLHDGTLCNTISRTRRIGVDYAGSAAEWRLRFFDTNSAAVSGPTSLNRKK